MKIHHKLFIVTGLTVFTVNMLENIIHYSIGASSNGENADTPQKTFHLHMPSGSELLKMAATSLIAGTIVGLVVKNE